jgi:hypothetical protein
MTSKRSLGAIASFNVLVTKTSALLKGPIRGNLSVNPRPFGDIGVIGREFRHAPAIDTAVRAITRAALSL